MPILGVLVCSIFLLHAGTSLSCAALHSRCCASCNCALQGNSAAVANAIAESAAKGGSNSAATAQVLAQALTSGKGQANAQAIGQAYTRQKGGVANALAQAITTVGGRGLFRFEHVVLWHALVSDQSVPDTISA
jgi:hypothetical protein